MKNQNRLLPLLAFSALFFSVPASVSAQDLVQDTLAVRILLDQNGLTTTPVSQVATVDSQRVTALQLTGLDLVTLPSEIGALSALKYLTLTNNLLDSLPPETWNLTALVELDLGGNQINALDPKVANLTKLLLLGLRDNILSSLPAEVYALPQLTTLLLAGNAMDTLPEAVANLAFLSYLDISNNQLASIPYTMAAMDLDSLDLSFNELDTLPDLITEMKAGTVVHLGSNHLCTLSGPLDAWAQGKDPGYKANQVCGTAVRARAARSAGPGLRAFADGDFFHVDFSGSNAGVTGAGGMQLIIRDVAGKVALRVPLAAGTRALDIPRTALAKARGFYWAELRGAGAFSIVTPVLPR